jgi:hypothetical protein
MERKDINGTMACAVKRYKSLILTGGKTNKNTVQNNKSMSGYNIRILKMYDRQMERNRFSNTDKY